jgi:release factor glutamine methyltransferase
MHIHDSRCQPASYILTVSLTLFDAIRKAADRLARAGVPNPRIDTELLLSHVLKEDRAWIFTHIRELLDSVSERRFQELVDRRSRREPLQYIIGRQEFWGREFTVTPDVLIPRPETELVVESAVHILEQTPHPTVIDVCTGSGCIAVSLAREFPDARVFATDISGRALAVARENARKHGAAGIIRFFEGDLFRPLLELDLSGTADIITANPPYIQARDLPSLQAEVRDYEPVSALIAGLDGTEIHRRIIGQAARFLKNNGALVLEMGIGKPEIVKDLSGIDRVIKVRKI